MWAVKTQEILWGVEEYLEEASAIHLDAIVAIITLMPRKRSAQHSDIAEGALLSVVYFIHLLVNGHLVCFHVLAIVSNAAMSVEVQISSRE